MQSSTLYFPSIEFRSAAALKASLLVWDRVYRIVPESYTPRDDDEVALAVDDGLIRSVRLEKTDVGEAATAFQALLDDFATLPSGFDPGGGVTNIHLDKIDARLYPVLEGLAEQISDQWIGLPSEVARGYMLTLATEVAKRRQLTLTTDDPDAWVASSFINERGAFSEFVYDNDAAEQYCQLGFADVLPLDVRTLDMKKLIALSRESTDDRAAFRANVAELAERVRLCESPSHAQDILSDYRDTLRSSTDALRNRFGFFRKTEGYSLLSVGIPIATSILASLLPAGLHAAPLIGGAVAVGLVGALGDSRRNTPPEDQIASYLLQVQRAEGRPMDDMRSRMEEFIND